MDADRIFFFKSNTELIYKRKGMHTIHRGLTNLNRKERDVFYLLIND